MSNLSEFLRTEAKVRQRNDDGIWTLLIEAAETIERQNDLRMNLDKRIHNQRVALRENWETIEMRASYRRAWYPSPLLRSIMMRSTIRRKETWWKRLLSYGTSHFHS